MPNQFPNVNPFQTLGLTPELVRSLSDESIQSCIVQHYRELQKRYHPDMKGGSAKMSQKFSDAFSLINRDANLEGFERFKQDFLREKKRASVVKETALREVVEAKGLVELSGESHLRFLEALCGTKDELSVFNLKNLNIKMTNYSRILNNGIEVSSKDKKGLKADPRNFFEINIDSEGQVTFEGLSRNKPKGVTQSKIMLAGCIDRDDLRRGNLELRSLLNNAGLAFLPQDSNLIGEFRPKKIFSRGTTYKTHYIKPDEFKHILPHLSPILKRYSYLFSVEKTNVGVFFNFEGIVGAIKALNQ